MGDEEVARILGDFVECLFDSFIRDFWRFI